MSGRALSHRGRPPERPRERGRSRPSADRHPDLHSRVQPLPAAASATEHSNPRHAAPSSYASYSSPSSSSAAAGEVSASSSSATSATTTTTTATTTATAATTTTDAPKLALSGVVVVCVIGHSKEDTSQLLDRLLDAQLFTSEWETSALSGSAGIWRGMEPLFAKDEWPAGLFEHYYSEEQKIVYIRLTTDLDSKYWRQHGRSKRSLEVTEDKALERVILAEGGHRVENGATDQWRQSEECRSNLLPLYTKNITPSGGVMQGEDCSTVQPIDAVEQHEGEAIRALLLAFCVSHVVIWMQDHARFHSPLVRILRLLQAAKHALGPFMKADALPALLPSPSPPLSRGGRVSGRGGGRQSPAVGAPIPASASDSGSPQVLLPGHFSPVLLFIHPDDYPESGSKGSESPETVDLSGSGSIAGRQVVSRRNIPEGPSGGMFAGGGGGGEGGRLWRATMTAAGGSLGKGSSTIGKQGNALTAALRKKAQSSLESQVRFLVKKCRVLGYSEAGAGSGGSGTGYATGVRGAIAGGPVSSTAGSSLFTLDPFRAVVFLDRVANKPGAVLDSISDHLDELFSSVVSGGSQTSEGMDGNGILTAGPGEDIEALRDFIWRQAEALRGRGTGTQSNPSSGAVGAMAAAAVGAHQGGERGGLKAPSISLPELPSLSVWTSAFRALSESLAGERSRGSQGNSVVGKGGITSFVVRGGKGGPVTPSSGGQVDSSEEEGAGRGRGGRRGMIARGGGRGGGRGDPAALKARASAAVSAALGCLEIATDIDLKFSATWCQKILPNALEVYTRNLPEAYTTTVHNEQLALALKYFRARVRGRAVEAFSEQLEAECEKVWQNGRQQCDAVSLTGRPCVHKLHPVPPSDSAVRPLEGFLGFIAASDISFVDQRSADEVKDSVSGMSLSALQRRGKKQWVKKGFQEKEMTHSSGAVFLHACACGRSRRLREDPFDIASANTDFSNFPGCAHSLLQLTFPERDGKSVKDFTTTFMQKSSLKDAPPQVLGAKLPVVSNTGVNAKFHTTEHLAASHVSGVSAMTSAIVAAAPLGKASWKVLRLGDADMYDRTIGLQQDGFPPGENFLCSVEVVLPVNRHIPELVNHQILHSKSLAEALLMFKATPVKGNEETTSVLSNAVNNAGSGGDFGREGEKGNRGKGGPWGGGRTATGSGRGEGGDGQEGGGEKREQPWVLARRPAHNQGFEGKGGILPIKGSPGIVARQEQGVQQQSEAGNDQSNGRDEAFPPLPQRHVANRGNAGVGRGSWQAGGGGGGVGVEKRGSHGRGGRREKGDAVADGGPMEQGKGEEGSTSTPSISVSEGEDFPPLPTVSRPGIIRLPISQKRVGVSGQRDVEDGMKSEQEVVELTGGQRMDEDRRLLEEPTTVLVMEEMQLWLGLEHECPQGHRTIWKSKSANVDSMGRGSSTVAGSGGSTPLGGSAATAEAMASRGLRQRLPGMLTASGSAAIGSERIRGRVRVGEEAIKNQVAGREVDTMQMGVREEGSLEGKGEGLCVLGSDVPIFKQCLLCKSRQQNDELEDGKFYGGGIAQLQRIYIVTPAHPMTFATRPIVEFAVPKELSVAEPIGAQQGQQKVQFSLPFDAVLPPKSMICVGLPFIYAVVGQNGEPHSLRCDMERPEMCARLVPWTAVMITDNPSRNTDWERAVAGG